MSAAAPIDLPSSRTRARKRPCDDDFVYDDDDDEEPPKTTVKSLRQDVDYKPIIAKSPRQKKVHKGGTPAALRVTSQENIDLFFRYLHRRMCVRVQMHQDKTILKKVPKPPMDPVLDLCTMGNAYRHLDSDDHAEGLILREYTGAALDARPTDKQLATMLIPCMLRVAGFNGQRMSEAVGRARGEHVDAESILAFPLCKAEALAVAAELRAVAAMPHNERPKRPSWFEGDASQVQGFGKWADAFALWFDESKPAGTLKQAVADLRKARRWDEANLILQRLKCVGDYTAAQGLCTLVFGAYEGDASQIFHPNGYDKVSMLDWCAHGPGPKTSIEAMFGQDANGLAGIRWLREHSDERFASLGIDFPYLVGEGGGGRRELSCVDLEHSLCYFSRYLSIKDKLRGSGSVAQGEERERKLWARVQAGNKGLPREKQLKRMRLKDLVKMCASGFDAALQKVEEAFERGAFLSRGAD